jgi:hypothetical protein
MDNQYLAPPRDLGPAEEQFQASNRIGYRHTVQVYGAIDRQASQFALRWRPLYNRVAIAPGLFGNTISVQPGGLDPADTFS